ncbi:MAG: hypothetical protein COT81_00805 [Candidatus Buchananbacteria bacterium CG10_big_fil_rev_8_21_14_0_10_42_9]|uniref:Nudix hydrolase domain-containing protein n=1 Tax=Candidatus Buchananbacteria bacterium CG10_big_fil_rev_8_21_14_0_10_42_9 TaxID=1974526 RepID=A0A2H0W2G1_9BACT|nr:MAG: hypothetical protein COT81_00805 [Candidatus Buchananbacteria bacterium CG10_big_fil_rev_8_21_14_0_10_42_9]
MSRWKKIKGKKVYSGFFGVVYEDEVINPFGKKHIYGYIVGPEYTPVVGYHEGKFLIVRQYRYTQQRFTWEFVSGALEKGLTPLKNAKKELLEESGYSADKWTKLAKLRGGNGFGTVFLAQSMKKVADPVPEVGGEIPEPKFVSRAELEKMIKSAKFDKFSHIASFYLAKDHLKL